MTTLAEKDPDVAKTYHIEASGFLVGDALRSYRYATNEVARAPRDRGFYFKATTPGRTASHYPQDGFPRSVGGTVTDGEVVWTAVASNDASVPTIDTVVWTLPAALTLDSQDEGPDWFKATISGGIDGTDYEVTARITPTAGNPVDATYTIPVRSL